MKPLPRSTWSVIAISAMLAVSAAAVNLHSGRKLDPAQTRSAVTALTTDILEHSQFAHHQLDDELAGHFLDRYLDDLDGGHMIFLESDVAEFARFRGPLAEATRSTGDSGPAQVIFQRYLERLGQRTAFVVELLKNAHFQFATDEQYQYDRKNAPRPPDLAAAHELWRQNLLFEFLQEKLAGKKDADIAQVLSRRSTRLMETMRKFNDQTVLDLYLNALAHVYDPHSDYMDHEQLQSFNIVMNHSLVGIGATLQSDDGFCKVGQLVPGGPAARGGKIKEGDRIVGVAQAKGKEFTDLVDMPLSQAVDLIRGAKGSTVYLEIIPASAAENAPRKTISIVRDEIKLEDQQAKARIVDLPAADGKARRIGMIDLPGFYSGENDNGVRTSATADVTRLVRKLQQEGVTGLILDLRRNGGGSLEEAINLTGLFTGSVPVVQTRTVDGRVEVGRSHDAAALYDGPLVVLVSRLSASASEIVAGALQDYGRAVIVGDSSTFGKGTVQAMMPLGRIMEQGGLSPSNDPGALKVTISKFYRPSGQSTQLAGVKSDIVLPSLTDIPEISEAKLENPLPWDSIPAASFTSENRVAPYLATLRSRSAERIASDSAFAWLKKDGELLGRNRDSKSISLNEAKRRSENDEIKTGIEARKKEEKASQTVPVPTYEITLKNLGQPGPGQPLKASKKAAHVASKAVQPLNDEDTAAAWSEDILLREAEHILSDYGDLLPNSKAATVTQR